MGMPLSPPDVRGASIQPARAEDLTAILDLLVRCGLPIEGMGQDPVRFLVARSPAPSGAGAVLGCVGLEIHGSSCLLRSFAVTPAVRGHGLALRLIRASLEKARAAGCAHAYLLTLTVERLALRHGFHRVTREEVPPSVLASREFSLTTCAPAAVMHLPLTSPD